MRIQDNTFVFSQPQKGGETRIPLAWEGSAGADVDKILPSYDEPADFDAFRTDHVVAMPPCESLADYEFRRLEWAHDSEGYAIKVSPEKQN